MQSITLNNITIQHLIGKGKYGEVYRCNNNEGNNNIESYAIKKINRKQVSKQNHKYNIYLLKNNV